MENYVSLDIGSHNLKMLYALRGENGQLKILGEAIKSTSDSVKEGVISNIVTLGTAIKEAKEEIESSCNITIRNVTVGISGSHIECSRITDSVKTLDVSHCIGSTDVRNLATQMQEVECGEEITICSKYPLYYEIDDNYRTNKVRVHDVVGSYSNSLSATYLFTFCKKEQLERIHSACKVAGITPSKIVLLPEVTPAAYLKSDEMDECVAVVDLGKGTTNISVVKDGHVCYIACVPIGINTIDKDLISYGIQKRHVEMLRKKYGQADLEGIDRNNLIHENSLQKDYSQFNIVTIIHNRLLDIVDCVQNELSRAHMLTDVVNGEGLILTGGGSLIAGLSTLFENKLRCKVLSTSLEYVNVDEDSQAMLSTGVAAPALGIILSQLDYPNEVLVYGKKRHEENLVSAQAPKQENNEEVEETASLDASATVTSPKEKEKEKEKDVEHPKKRRFLGRFRDAIHNSVKGMLTKEGDYDDDSLL